MTQFGFLVVEFNTNPSTVNCNIPVIYLVLTKILVLY